MIHSKKLISILLVCCLLCGVVSLAGCTKARTLSDCPIIHEPEFGGVYIERTIDEFNALGYAYGDSVNVRFSNGYTLEDLPYYNGFYTANGEPLLIAYPGYDYIKAAINNGDDLWTVAGLSEGDLAEITLCERGKYLDVQKARDIHYEDDRELFETDEAFANFRSIEAGTIREGYLFRSASPCDNQHNRAPYVDALMGVAGVDLIIDLADNVEKIAGYLNDPEFNSPNFLELYRTGNVVPLALNMNFGSEEFRAKIAQGLTAMAERPGPYLIHCTEGKDRTGFVCMLLEALCGADYQQIVDDYMITYDNYYGITPSSDRARYDAIVEKELDPMIRSMIGDESADLAAADLQASAEAFLRAAGMTDEQIAAVQARLTA